MGTVVCNSPRRLSERRLNASDDMRTFVRMRLRLFRHVIISPINVQWLKSVMDSESRRAGLTVLSGINVNMKALNKNSLKEAMMNTELAVAPDDAGLR